MAQALVPTFQYASEDFVESCGAVLFDMDPYNNKVCLIYHLQKDEWYLPKGRRNQGESRRDAAIREVMEETGYRCHLRPTTIPTRAPHPSEDADAPNRIRVGMGLVEPFMFTLRKLDLLNVKIIWWYIAALDENARLDMLRGEAAFKAEFFPLEEAHEKLTFQSDRVVLERAILLVEETEIE